MSAPVSGPKPARWLSTVAARWLAAVAALSLSLTLAACTRATDQPTPGPHLSELPDPSPQPLAATAHPTYSPTLATPIPTPTALTAPAAILGRSPVVVDSARGRLYASDLRDDAVELTTYRADTGQLTSTQPLLPGELLLDVGDSGELYVLGAGWEFRVLDRTGDQLRSFAVPTPHWSDPAFQAPAFPQKPAFPLIDRARGRILAFSGPHVTVIDSATGTLTRQFEVPPAGTHGSVVAAALDESGDTLYLAMGDPGLGDWEGSPGVRLMALDWATLHVLDQTALRAQLTTWIPTGDGVIASGDTYKLRGSDQRVWKKGREVARRTEAGTSWSAYDQKRRRAMGYSNWNNDAAVDVVVADGDSLDLQSVSPFELNHLDRRQGDFAAYDPKTDQFYARGQDPDQLVTVSAASLGAAKPLAPRDVDYPVTPTILLWARQRSGPAQLTLGSFIRPLRLGEPTPDPVFGGPPGKTFGRAFSTDGGATWQDTGAPARTIAALPGGLVASPAFERDQTLFGSTPGYGVFRSTDAGRSWQPSSGGLGALEVREVVLSPDYASDGSLIAVAENSYREDGSMASAWMSRDRGRTWSPVGAFTTVAFSPDYARDRRLLAFDSNRFHLSHDGGQTWHHAGNLGSGSDIAGRLWVIPGAADRPEVLLALTTNDSVTGGGAHWPESGAHVYRSVDDGLT